MIERPELKTSDLGQLVTEYLNSRSVSIIYQRQLHARCQAFAAFAGDDAPITAAVLNNFLFQCEPKMRARTLKGYRTAIMTVLTFAGWRPERPIRVVKVKQQFVDCFTLEEMRAILKCAAALQGILPNGITWAHFWQLAVHAGYSTGLRWGDLMTLRKADVDEFGIVRMTQSKTGKVVAVRLSPKAFELMGQHDKPECVPWPYTQEHFRQEFAILLAAAGVRRGCWKWLRRSAGSYAEKENPGKGHLLLGNTRDVFQGNYASWAVIAPDPIEPPPLDDSSIGVAYVGQGRHDPPAATLHPVEPSKPFPTFDEFAFL